MPIIDLTDEELAAVIAAVRRAIGDDRYPMSPGAAQKLHHVYQMVHLTDISGGAASAAVNVGMRLIYASALFLFPLHAQAASSTPNDCWFGVMAADKGPQGQLVATGPVLQWRVGMSLTLYTTKETGDQADAPSKKGQTDTFDMSRPITVIPTWISGPQPGNKDDTDKAESIEIAMQYSTAQGETGTITLTYWTPMSGHETSLPSDQQEVIAQVDQRLHDVSCRGIP